MHKGVRETSDQQRVYDECLHGTVKQKNTQRRENNRRGTVIYQCMGVCIMFTVLLKNFTNFTADTPTAT